MTNKDKNPYQTNKGGRIEAINKPTAEPVAQKTVSNKDLRAGRGK